MFQSGNGVADYVIRNTHGRSGQDLTVDRAGTTEISIVPVITFTLVQGRAFPSTLQAIATKSNLHRRHLRYEGVDMPPFIPRKRRRSPSPLPSSPNSAERTPTKKPTLFDTLDAKPKILTTVQDNKAFLDELNGDSDSSLSDISSSDFEDVIADQGPPKRRKVDDDENEEEEMEWEDAMVPDVSMSGTPVTTTSKDLEITLGKEAQIGTFTDPHGTKKGPSKRDRQIRVATHCMHVQFLMFHNAVRNAWICDEEVQKILVAQLPQGVRKAIEKWKLASGITVERPQEEESKSTARVKGRQTGSRKATKPVQQRDWGQKAEKQEEGKPNMSRGDPLVRLLKILAAYWKKKFTITAPGLRKQGYKPLAVLATEIASFRNDSHNAEEHGERINDLTEFRKIARKCEGSRDVGAQLFTALIRGLGLEVRMVASLQPAGFGWSKSEDAAIKKTNAGQHLSSKASGSTEHNDLRDGSETDDSSADSVISKNDLAAVDPRNPKPEKSSAGAKGSSAIRGKTKGKGKGLKDSPIDLAEDSSDSALATDEEDDLSIVEIAPQLARNPSTKRWDRDLHFPIYWTEVISPITKKIIPVDPLILTPPVATNDVLLSSFEPRGAKADKAKQVLAYVVAFSPDGTAKDVTTRYLKRHMWPGKTKGMRLPIEKVPIHNKRGKIKGYEEYDWFKTVMSGYRRTDNMRTAVDDVEEQTDLKPVKPEKKVATEGEETLQGYKTSAEFVLERHLRREEALIPGAQHVGIFKSGKAEKAKEERVFRRQDVKVCRTGESWHKEGRQVKPGEYPMKMVPVRAVTLLRKREVEEAQRDTGEKLKQGLYAWDQTDWIIPPPIEDGIIPKNAFGNIDCYVPTMVPEGAVHIRRKGTVKVCKRLGIDFAEAVTGFEFGKQRAVPVITGVVVAKEYRKMVIDAWEIDEEERRRKEEGKREKVALAMWRKFLMGLRIVERVREEYGGEAAAHAKEEMNPFTNRNKMKQQASNANIEPHSAKDELGLNNEDHDMAGGFLPEDHIDAVDGGGFVPEAIETGEVDAEPKSIPEALPGRRTVLVADASVKTPRSLQSAHREVSQASSRSDASEVALTETVRRLGKRLTKKKTPKPASKASKPKHKADIKPMANDGTVKNQGRKERPRFTKPDTDESSDLTSLEYTSDNETSNIAADRKGISRASRGAVDHHLSPVNDLYETSPAPTNGHSNRMRPKRTAARRSDIAVKSHYFDHAGTEDEDDVEKELSDEDSYRGSKTGKNPLTGSTGRTRGKRS